MIEVNNLTKTPVNEDSLKTIGRKILAKEGIKKEVGVSVALVGKKKIQELNRTYRDKDQPTDVLSFGKAPKFISPPSQAKLLGEIVICPSQIKPPQQLKPPYQHGGGREKVGLGGKGKKEEEIIWLFIHGLLHLLGYSHQTKKEAAIMETKQKNYLTLFKRHGSGS